MKTAILALALSAALAAPALADVTVDAVPSYSDIQAFATDTAGDGFCRGARELLGRLVPAGVPNTDPQAVEAWTFTAASFELCLQDLKTQHAAARYTKVAHFAWSYACAVLEEVIPEVVTHPCVAFY